MKLEKYIGQRFERLVILSTTDKKRYGLNLVLCKCDCGNTKEVVFSHMKRGQVKSCGCMFKERGKWNKKHGLTHTRIFTTWIGMKQRTTNPKATGYKNYGGRGIRVCDEWINDVAAFAKWAEKNGYVEGLEIDRIDNDGNYEHSNCRFVTRQENLKNKPKTQRKTLLN